MKARGFYLTLTVQLNGWELDLSDPTDAALYALHHSPIVKRWTEYPAPMRDAWRTRLGSGWAAQLMLPPALEPLEPELLPALPDADQVSRDLPERNDRPPDVPPPPQLPPASPQLVPPRRRHTASAGGMPF